MCPVGIYANESRPAAAAAARCSTRVFQNVIRNALPGRVDVFTAPAAQRRRARARRVSCCASRRPAPSTARYRDDYTVFRVVVIVVSLLCHYRFDTSIESAADFPAEHVAKTSDGRVTRVLQRKSNVAVSAQRCIASLWRDTRTRSS